MKSINVLLASVFLAFSASLQAQIDTLSSKTLLMKGKIKKVEEKLSNIDKLFLNYDGEYEKIDLDWDNEVGKEVW